MNVFRTVEYPFSYVKNSNILLLRFWIPSLFSRFLTLLFYSSSHAQNQSLNHSLSHRLPFLTLFAGFQPVLSVTFHNPLPFLNLQRWLYSLLQPYLSTPSSYSLSTLLQPIFSIHDPTHIGSLFPFSSLHTPHPLINGPLPSPLLM